MAHSGLTIKDECHHHFCDIKVHKKKQFVVYKISDCKTAVEVDFPGPSTKDDEWKSEVTIPRDKKEPLEYTYFRQKMTEAGSCRYGVFDLKWEEADKPGGKVCFICWAPDTAKMNDKMLYTSSKSALQKKLDGIADTVQANDSEELSYVEVVDRLSKGKAKEYINTDI